MKKLKALVYELLSKKPGRRFLHISSKVNKSLSNKILIKAVCIILGIISLSAGILMLFIPGPGLLFMLSAAILFSACSESFAKFLDRAEKRLRVFLARKKHDD